MELLHIIFPPNKHSYQPRAIHFHIASKDWRCIPSNDVPASYCAASGESNISNQFLRFICWSSSFGWRWRLRNLSDLFFGFDGFKANWGLV